MVEIVTYKTTCYRKNQNGTISQISVNRKYKRMKSTKGAPSIYEITPEKREKVLELYKTNKCISKIARQVELSGYQVNQVLKRENS